MRSYLNIRKKGRKMQGERSKDSQSSKLIVCESCGKKVSLREVTSHGKCPVCGEMVSGNARQVLRS